MDFVRGMFTTAQSETKSEPSPRTSKKNFNLLVVDGGSTNWSDVDAFKAIEGLTVYQGGFRDLSLSCYSSERSQNSALVDCYVTLVKQSSRSSGMSIQPGSKQMFRVDFVLIREECRGLLSQSSMRAQLHIFLQK